MSGWFQIDKPMELNDFIRISNDYNYNVRMQEKTESEISDLYVKKSEVKRAWGASVNKKKKSSSFWISILAYALLSAILYFALVPNVVELSGGVIFLWGAIFVVLLIIVYCVNSGHEKNLMDKIENRPELKEKLTEEQKKGLIAAEKEVKSIDTQIDKLKSELQSLEHEESNDLFWVKTLWEEGFREIDKQLTEQNPPKQYVVNGKTVSVDMKKVLLKDFESRKVIDKCISQYLGNDVKALAGNGAGTPVEYMTAAFTAYVSKNQRTGNELEAEVKKEIERQLKE